MKLCQDERIKSKKEILMLRDHYQNLLIWEKITTNERMEIFFQII